MHKTQCGTEQEKITYQITPSGRANVWLRGAATKVETPSTDEDQDPQESYEQDEVFFTVDPELITKDQIDADFDFFFANAPDDGKSADAFGIDALKATKHDELSAVCTEAIQSGVDVELSTGKTEHFSLTQNDQLNLFGKQVELGSGELDHYCYHCDGEPCKDYSKDDMQKICTEAISYVTYHTTYVNSIFNWIRHCTKASELAAITYGSEIPEEYKSEVLKEIEEKMKSAS